MLTSVVKQTLQFPKSYFFSKAHHVLLQICIDYPQKEVLPSASLDKLFILRKTYYFVEEMHQTTILEISKFFGKLLGQTCDFLQNLQLAIQTTTIGKLGRGKSGTQLKRLLKAVDTLSNVFLLSALFPT